MKFRPLHDRVVIRRIEEDEKTAGGIIIPDTAKEKPSQGEVVAVGPGARNEKGATIAPDVKVGDVVLYGQWSGTEVKIDGKELLIMKASDIMSVLEATKSAQQAALSLRNQSRGTDYGCRSRQVYHRRPTATTPRHPHFVDSRVGSVTT